MASSQPENKKLPSGKTALHVHWRGFVADPRPTEYARAAGNAVWVYESDYFGDPSLMRLPATRYPLPEPWGERLARFHSSDRDLMCGGDEGARFLTEGHGMWLVPEDVYCAAQAGGFRRIPVTWESMTQDDTVDVCEMTEAVSDGRLVKVGGSWFSPKLFGSLWELGAKTLHIMDPPTHKLIAPGIGMIMPIAKFP